jgi:stearoyl-CoA desaturase (delta-9 desaturase)
LWHAHMGWLFTSSEAPPEKYAIELTEEPFMTGIGRMPWYLLIALMSLFGVPALLGFLIAGPMGAVFGIVWMGLVRAFFLLQSTFMINSVCHVFGRRNFETTDQSRNVWWLALPTLGEAWHNGHHAFPSSFRHGLAGGLDLSALLVLLLEKLGWAHELRRISPERVEQKLLDTA